MTPRVKDETASAGGRLVGRVRQSARRPGAPASYLPASRLWGVLVPVAGRQHARNLGFVRWSTQGPTGRKVYEPHLGWTTTFDVAIAASNRPPDEHGGTCLVPRGQEFLPSAQCWQESAERGALSCSVDSSLTASLGCEPSTSSGCARGSAVMRVRAGRDIRPDTVFAAFHYGGPGAVNQLTNPALDPNSGMPEFKACAVAIDRVDAPETAPA